MRCLSWANFLFCRPAQGLGAYSQEPPVRCRGPGYLRRGLHYGLHDLPTQVHGVVLRSHSLPSLHRHRYVQWYPHNSNQADWKPENPAQFAKLQNSVKITRKIQVSLVADMYRCPHYLNWLRPEIHVGFLDLTAFHCIPSDEYDSVHGHTLEYSRTTNTQVYIHMQAGYRYLLPCCIGSGSLAQLHRPQNELCCSCFMIEITSTWLPIPFWNSDTRRRGRKLLSSYEPPLT